LPSGPRDEAGRPGDPRRRAPLAPRAGTRPPAPPPMHAARRSNALTSIAGRSIRSFTHVVNIDRTSHSNRTHPDAARSTHQAEVRATKLGARIGIPGRAEAPGRRGARDDGRRVSGRALRRRAGTRSICLHQWANNGANGGGGGSRSGRSRTPGRRPHRLARRVLGTAPVHQSPEPGMAAAAVGRHAPRDLGIVGVRCTSESDWEPAKHVRLALSREWCALHRLPTSLLDLSLEAHAGAPPLMAGGGCVALVTVGNLGCRAQLTC
jgi:hypothetical protein